MIELPPLKRDILGEILAGIVTASAVLAAIYLFMLVYEFGYMRGEAKGAKKPPFELHQFRRKKEPSPHGR